MRLRHGFAALALLVALATPAHGQTAPTPSVSYSAIPAQAGQAAAFVQQVNTYAYASAKANSEREAAAAAATHARHSRPSMPSGSGDCANPVVSQAVAMRESGCHWDAYNASGCGGRGCIGFYQEDAGHYYAHSPWNPSQPGACYGLDSSTQEGQTACAERLGPDAWG